MLLHITCGSLSRLPFHKNNSPPENPHRTRPKPEFSKCIFELKMPRPVIWQRFTSTNSCHGPPLTKPSRMTTESRRRSRGEGEEESKGNDDEEEEKEGDGNEAGA